MNIKNMYIFKNIVNSVLLQCLVILVSVLYFESALAVQYKCKDANGNVTYSDERCSYQTRQKLDIIVAPVDKPSAERLKYYQKKSSTPPDVKSNIITIEPQRPIKGCDGYAAQIKQLKNQLRAGYEPEAGENIRKSINHISELYNNCKKNQY